MRVQGDILIERPIEEVFDFVADERNEPKYNAQMTQADKVTPGSIGVGTKFHSFMTGVGGTAEMTVEFIEFIRPKRIVETTHLSTMDINGALYFEPVAEGTRMTWGVGSAASWFPEISRANSGSYRRSSGAHHLVGVEATHGVAAGGLAATSGELTDVCNRQ